MAVAAVPAEVGFSAEFVALIFAFLFLWLAIVILDSVRPSLLALAGRVPLVGAGLAGALAGGIDYLRGWLAGQLSQSLIAYSTLLNWLNTVWTATANMALYAQAEVVSSIFRIRTIVIPAYQAQVVSWAEGQIAAARAYALAQGVAAQNLARGLAAAAEAQAVALFQTAEADVLRLVQAERVAAEGLFAIAEQDAIRLVESERAVVANQILGVEAEVQAAFRQAVAISTAAEQVLRGDIGAVQQELSGAIRGEVDSLLRQIEADKEALSKALEGGLAGVIADVAAIRALRCIQRCAELGAYGDVLATLNVAAVFALYEVAIHNPQAAAGFLSGTLRPALYDFDAQAREVLGG